MHYIELVREDTGKRTLIPANDIGFSEDGNKKTKFWLGDKISKAYIPWSYDAVLEAITQSKGFVSFPIRDKE